MHRDTDDNREITSRNPVPMADCEDIMLRVVVFESTQTQASSKYFLQKKSPLQKSQEVDVPACQTRKENRLLALNLLTYLRNKI